MKECKQINKYLWNLHAKLTYQERIAPDGLYRTEFYYQQPIYDAILNVSISDYEEV